MVSKVRHVALLLFVLGLMTGLASAQPGLNISQIDGSGQVTQSAFNPAVYGPEARAPRAGKYWDGLATTDYYNFTTQVTAPPNPQIGVGPDDVVTIVNRTIARYPNPNAIGNPVVTTPYTNPPTSKAWLDVWLGIANLNAVCPTAPRSNATCVIDNASIRYDQMQGRFVVLFTATDVPSHISNFILVTSRYATFACPPGVTPANCPNTSDMFTPPIVPIVGGPNTGGVNQYWMMYIIPVNIVLPAPTTSTAGAAFCMAPFVGGNPLSAPAPIGMQQVLNGFSTGPITTGCSDYFPTAARFGLDNDNIILTAPVLDVSLEIGPVPLSPGCLSTAAMGCGPVLPGGPYAGTRVVTVPKVVVFNGVALGGDPRNVAGTGTGLVNLSDDSSTGTLTGLPAGPVVAGVAPAPDLTRPPNATCNPQCAITLANVVPSTTSLIPPIFWEPDNLRGRALASFDAQVAPINAVGSAGSIGGVITPIDYLVGKLVTDSFGQFVIPPGFAATTIFVQPIIFTCPVAALFAGPAGVPYCGTPSAPNNPGGGQVAETAVLGVLSGPGVGATAPNVTPQATGQAFGAPGGQQPGQLHTLATTADPATVGQGKNDAAPNLAQDGTPMPRLFVGDQRPQQVMFREGLLYAASTVRLFDNVGTVFPFNTATVMYNVLKTPGPTCNLPQTPAFVGGTDPCLVAAVGGTGQGNPYTPNGSRIAQTNEAIETYWYNGTNVPDPTGNINGYGFYAPAFDSPANVVNGSSLPNSSGISPINLFPWLEKLFVGNTVGGPSTINNTFATHYASIWDVRPGDDGYDTNLPYLDPVSGTIIISDTRLCQPPFTALVTTTAGSRVLSALAPVASSLPLAVGQLVTGTGIPAGATVSAICIAACTSPVTAPANSVIISAAATITQNRVTATFAAPPPGGAAGQALCSMVPFGFRAGASTDPNDGSLWVYAPFAKARMSTLIGPGQWGTSVANYQLDFPSPDPYGNDNAYFGDVTPSYPDPFRTAINIARTAGLFTQGFAGATCPTSSQGNPPVVPPPAGTSSGGTVSGPGQVCTNFQPTDQVTRAEMAMWVIRSQMDDQQVLNFLNATGGIPNINGLGAASFADNPSIPAVAGCPVPSNPPQGSGTQFCSAQTIANYIEAMYRRGYTKGCSSTNDGRRMYCPADLVTRGQMSIFLIRAKMANVFPTSLSGIPVALSAGPSQGFASVYGDAFGFFTPAQPYFTDCSASSCGASAGIGANGPYIYIQKMRELRITNGTTGITYSPDTILTRQEIAVFVVRAFLQ